MNASGESSTLERRRSFWTLLETLPVWRITVFVVQFQLVLLLSVLTPFLIRHWTTAQFIVHEEPLEFTFKTCGGRELAGVCSFPEALLELDRAQEREGRLELHAGYSHSFELEFTIHSTEAVRHFGVFIAQLELTDGNGNALVVYRKSGQVPKFAKEQVGGWMAIVWWPLDWVYFAARMTRNAVFWPLYIVGYFNPTVTETVEAIDASTISLPATVSFNSRSTFFTESASAPARQLVVRVENRHLEIASATLRVRAHVGWWCWLHSYFPIISFLSLAAVSFTSYFFIFIAYWARIGLAHFNREDRARQVEATTDSDQMGSRGGKESAESSTANDSAVGLEQQNKPSAACIDGWEESSLEDA